MKVEELYDFEKYTLSSLAWLMVKWFNYETVEMRTESRGNVESGIWITVKILVTRYDDGVHRPGNEWIISGQRKDIVQRRLADFLKERHPMPGINQP